LTVCLAAPAMAAELGVFLTPAAVTERKKVDDATKKELKAKKDAASKARKELEKELKGQHGKKREEWPTDVDDKMVAAEEVEARANADYEYMKVETKALKDSTKDVTEEIEGLVKNKVVTLVPSAAEADLVLQIEGRRGEKTMPTQLKPDRCYVLFSIGPGGKAGAAERFAKVPAWWRPRRFGSFKVEAPKPPESTAFLFESNNGFFGGQFGCFSGAADGVAKTLPKIIEENKLGN
jgi:hypothetical protein